MKKITILLCLLLFSGTGFGQIKLGIKAGASATSAAFYSPNQNGQKETREGLKYVPGYTLGLTAEQGFTRTLSLQTGLQITRKGYKEHWDGNYGAYYKITHSFTYLETPINLAYKLGNLQVHAGPYAGIGLGGHLESESYRGSSLAIERSKLQFRFKDRVSESDRQNLENGQTYRRRLDLGLNLGAGYRFGSVQLTATYSHGLSHHQPEFEDDLHNFNNLITHKGISLAATWFFWQK